MKSSTACFFRHNRLRFSLAVAGTLLNTLLGFGITWILQQMLDAAVGVPGAMGIRGLAAGALGVILSLVAVKVLVCSTRPAFLRKAMTQYKSHVFGRMLMKSSPAFSRESSGDYLSAFSSDMASIETNYLEGQFLLIRNAVEMTGALVMMLWYNPLMTAVSMGFLLLPMAAAALEGRRMESAEQAVSAANSRLLSLLGDCLSGFSVIKSFSAEARMAGLMDRRIGDTEQIKCRKRKLTVLLESTGSLAALTAQLGTFLTGTVLILSGVSMTPGVLVAFMDLTSTFIDPVSELPAMLGNRRAAGALIRKLDRALDRNRREGGDPAPETLTRGITLQDLSYGYTPEAPVLRSLNFTFRAGGSYAIVGASGSGKSTLLNLLQGTEAYEGRILYDDRELRTLCSASLCGLVSVIQQNVFIFNASIEDNITLFGSFPPEAVRRAAELSGLSRLMEEKGPGYLCGENGCSLSGGEKQRISIARSLLQNCRVLLADEVTAALDAKTARQVSQAILDLPDMTRILVTHSLDEALLSRCDCILAMKGGTIAESGTYRELMDRKGYFWSLCTVSA